LHGLEVARHSCMDLNPAGEVAVVLNLIRP
jgi:hypothetical protein